MAAADNGELAPTPAQETVIKVLDEARELLAAPGCWTQGASARDAQGRDVNVRAHTARQWSLDGALWKVAPTVADAALAGICVRAALNLPTEDPTALWAWGDAPGRTLEGVRRALWSARDQVRQHVQGRTLSVTRAIHKPVPVPLEAPARAPASPATQRAGGHVGR